MLDDVPTMRPHLIRLRDDEHLEMVAGLGRSTAPTSASFTIPVQRGLVGRCLREGRVVLVGDVTARARLRRHPGDARRPLGARRAP